MNLSCTSSQPPPHPSPPLFFWLHATNMVSNAGHLWDAHSLLSVTSADVTQPWTPASSFTEQPEIFRYGPKWEIGAERCHIMIKQGKRGAWQPVSLPNRARRWWVGWLVYIRHSWTGLLGTNPLPLDVVFNHFCGNIKQQEKPEPQRHSAIKLLQWLCVRVAIVS